MRISNKITISVIVFLILIIAFILFAIKITTISVPDPGTELTSEKIDGRVNIFRNSYGIPKIIAGNEYEMFFGVGYTHAQDRLWQMDVLRRRASGRLSEIFGKRTLLADKFAKTLELEQTAEFLYDSVSQKTRNILNAYSDGVNFYIQENRNKLSFEFSALSYHPDSWEPEDCLMISRAMALEMSFSFWYDITFGEIAEKFGTDKAFDLIPGYPDNTPRVLQDNNNLTIKRDIRQDISFIKDFNHLSDSIHKVIDIWGWSGNSKGSNSWVVKKNREDRESGVILANDPHLILSLPNIWMPMHTQCPSMDVLGYTMAGMPMMLAGRNESISWGITNLMGDVCDFFIQKIDSTGNYYFKDEKTQKIDFETDTIKVKGDSPVVYYKQIIDGSPVISGFHLFRDDKIMIEYDKQKHPSDFLNDYALTFKWTATHFSDEFQSLYEMNSAQTWDKFKKGNKKWGSPPLVFSYADTSGNFAIAPTGILPKREKKCSPVVPNPGWRDSYSWDGIINAEKLSYLYKPSSGYVLSANNPVSDNFDFFISDYWEIPSRSIRINELIEISDNIDSREIQHMQVDVLSPYARKFSKKLIEILDSFEPYLTKQEQIAYDELKEWDHLMSATQVAPSIFNAFLYTFANELFYDEMDDRLFKQFCFVYNISTRKMMDLINRNESYWFDNKNTDPIESKEEIVLTSFKKAVQYLRNKFETNDISLWKYGKINTLTLEHLFSENEFLKPIVTSEKLEMGGNNTTISNAASKYYEPFKITVGASMRFIADMDEDHVLMSMPGGTSGDPINPHYSDQTRLWLNGGYLTIPYSTHSQEYTLYTLITGE